MNRVGRSDSGTLPSVLLGINLEVGLLDPRVILFSNFQALNQVYFFLFFFRSSCLGG